MNINTMLKGGLIALFFSTQIMAFDKPETVQPKSDPIYGGNCSSYFSGLSPTQLSLDECLGWISSHYSQDRYSEDKAVVQWNHPTIYDIKAEFCKEVTKIDGTVDPCGTYTVANLGTYNQKTNVIGYSKSCPPEQQEYKDYIYPVSDDDGEITACDDDNPAFQKCPQGNYKYAVKGECVPIECPPTGTADTIWGNGKTYTNNSGTYCNGQCAFTVGGEQNNNGSTGNIPLQVVSNGAICGDGTGSWHSDGNGDDNCTKSGLPTGSVFVTCSNGNTDTGEENEKPIDLSEQKDEEPLELIGVKAPCDPVGGEHSFTTVVCELRNTQEKLDNENKELKAEQQEQHNKKIEADEKAAIKLVNAIQEFKDYNTIGNEQIVAAIKADTGTGSSGGGSGTVTLDGEGAGLEDSEIGEAFGGLDDEITENTVTLSNYSAPYSGWISTSGCPSTQSTTLTINGITSTFDADHTPMCSFFTFLGKILLAASYVGVAFMIQRSI